MCPSQKTAASISASPLDSFSASQLEQHREIVKRQTMIPSAMVLLNKLWNHKWNFNGLFNTPVTKAIAPDYESIIKSPMDLGTVKKKLLSFQYDENALESFFQDITQTFDNAMLYNPPLHPVHEAAAEIKRWFITDLFPKFKLRLAKRRNRVAAHSCRDCVGNVCKWCNEKCRLLVLPKLYCFSTNDFKNTPSNKHHQLLLNQVVYSVVPNVEPIWCEKCYSKIPKDMKKVVRKYRYQDQLTEDWVRCDSCDEWYHQACVMFNSESNNAVGFTCPVCRLDRLSNKTRTYRSVLQPIQLMADNNTYNGFVKEDSLVKTPLSDFMQDYVNRSELSSKNNFSTSSITIRLVSNVSKSVSMNPGIMSETSSPSDRVTYRSKAIMVFQKLNGLQVCIFCMYVYEQDDVTYIAYLDSLDYVVPREHKSLLYQTIVVAYLAACQKRQFKKAMIWACPPLKKRNSDFIFWAHPSWQKNPDKDRLLSWYKEGLIAKATEAGIVSDCSDMYDVFFKKQDDIKKFSVPPYFPGDYWISEYERLESLKPKKSNNKPLMPDVIEGVKLNRDVLFVLSLEGEMGQQEFSLTGPAIKKKKVLAMTDPEIECPMVDDRGCFLQECERNRLQFDSLRRAQYSTMMLIYKLHHTTKVSNV